LLFDQLKAIRNIAKRNGEIADVGELHARTRIDPPARIRSIHEHAARATISV